MLPSAIAEATAAFDRALRGDLGPTLALLDALDASSDPVTVAWKQKLHAAASLLAADEDPLFEAPRDTLAAGETLDGPGALLCDEIQGLKALRAFIAFRGLGNSDSAPRHGFGTASDAWHRLLRGEGPPEAVMDGLIAEAVRAKSSARLVEATAVASLAALSEGKLDRAVMLARRGSRMARTEELCAHAYLANLVLARARRITGFPSQALRIAGALSAVVPSPWQHWVRWEQAMAGHLDGLGAEAEDPRACVRDLLAAAKSGDRVRFEALGQSLVELAGDWVDAQRDAHALLFSLDPARQSQDPTMGRALHAPMAVHLRSFGASITSAEDGSAGVRVYAAPGQVTCRILESGVGFLPPGFEPVALAQRRDARVAAVIVELLQQAPTPVGRAALFEAVYGFAFVPSKHESTFRMTLHRVGNVMEPAGKLVHDPASVGISLRRACLVTDPRVSPSLEERVLRVLGTAGRLTAGEIAGQLGVSVRAVQLALKPLTEEGACQKERNGRELRYLLEDTTFHEPTQLRPRAS